MLKNWFIKVLLILLEIYFLQTTSKSSMAQSVNFEKLSLIIESTKESYLPGEVVKLRIKAVNSGNSPVLIYKGTNVLMGRAEVFISSKSEEFMQYKGPGWYATEGFYPLDIAYQRLDPGEAYVSIAKILDSISTPERILKNWYAFPEPGEYRVKARFYDDAYKKFIESEPLKIMVLQPQGVDLKVWNYIKKDRDIIYFLHTSEISQEDEKTLKPKINYLLTLYPMSSYAKYIRQIFEQSQNREAYMDMIVAEQGFCVEKNQDKKNKCYP